MSTNPYAAPRADVRDIDEAQEYQKIHLWSAKGRIGRLRYLAYTFGAALVVGFVLGLLSAVLGPDNTIIALLLAYIPLLVFSVLTAIKRSHDMNWSAWTVLLTLIPFVALIWIFKSGSAGSNDYGASPPPNTVGVKILAFLLPALFIIGIIAAIAIPAYVTYQQGANGM
jgi:uncharacterized membrane protein YhaH (DUF805 family)